METREASYYAEILILVDGWPWNLSEFDFRRWFAPGRCPRALEPVEIAAKTERERRLAAVSENRRVGARTGGKRRRRARKQKAA